MRKYGPKTLWFSAALLLCATLCVSDTQCRNTYPDSIDDIYMPEVQTQTQTPPENKDYLQVSGQIVWLAPWDIPEYQSENLGSPEERSYTFSLESPAAQTVTATSTANINVSVSMSGNTLTVNVSLTEAGRRLLICKKEEIQVVCGNTSATLCLWLLPQGTEIPRNADAMPVDVNQICKKQTQGVHLQDGKAYLLLNSANRNAYILSFQEDGRALEGLRYSLDDGVTYTQLHDWNKIYLPLQTSENTLLILDYSLCGITEQSDLKVVLERQNDDTHKQQMVTLSVENTNPGDDLPEWALVTTEQPWSLSLGWNGCDYSWQAYRLTQTDRGLAYVQVQMPEGFVTNATAQELKISIRSGEDAPLAGTYQLLLQWSFEGIVCGEATIPFFINYPLM